MEELCRTNKDANEHEEIVTVEDANEHEEIVTVKDANEHEEIVTVEDAINKIGCGRFQFRLLVFLGIFSFAESCEGGLTTVLQPTFKCEWGLTHEMKALLPLVFYVTKIAFGLIWGYCADRYGRKPILVIVSCLMAYIGFLTTFSPSFTWVLIFRSIIGACIGAYPLAFALLSEFYPTKQRAYLLVCHQCFASAGAVFQYIMAMLVIPTLGWRWHVAFSCIPAAFMMFCFIFVPESPRFLLTDGKVEQTNKILGYIAKSNHEIMPNGKLQPLKKAQRGSIKELFATSIRWTTIILVFISLFNAFSYHGTQFFITEFHVVKKYTCGGGDVLNEEGCSCRYLTRDDYINIIIASLGKFIGLLMNFAFIDSIGRKKTIALEQLLGCVFFLLFFVCLPGEAAKFLFFMLRGVTNGSSTVIFIYLAEVFPTVLRSTAMGFCYSLGEIGSALTSHVATVLIYYSVPATLGIYAATFLVVATLAMMLPIETKGNQMKDVIEGDS